MKKISEFIANHSGLILIICLLLIIPSILGYVNTRINYDILVYLPEDIDTIKGENILTDDFGLGAYAFVMVDSTNNKKIINLEEEIKNIEGVNKVISLADVTDTMIPISMLPSKVVNKLNKDDETIIMVTFTGSTSEDQTIKAVKNLRTVVKDATKVSSMTSMVIDTQDLSNKEMILYVIIAVIFCLVILFLATDSYIIPFLLLGNIGIAIIYNMGTNILLGEISYITKAITAILQLGVTMDFSIFLYHKYDLAKSERKNKYEAMSKAIRETFQSVIGSSLTTFAGFLALCTMDLTLGTDIGIVMAKGVLCGLICVLTLFPALLIAFDGLITKTKHKNIFPKFKKIQEFCVYHYKFIIVCFLVLLIPAYIGNSRYSVYYKLDESLPKDLAFNVANSNLSSKFNIISPEIIILNKDIKTSEINKLVEELNNIEGIDLVLAPSTLVSEGTKLLLPDDLQNIVANDKYQLIIINSVYEIASNELSNQIEKIDSLVKKYDDNGIIAGEGPLMNDLVTLADHDFKIVNYTSIIVIFIIMVFVLKQIALPIVLVIAIEFAIFINMAIAYYTGAVLPFIASIVVGTIQLGATIDYAILMSTKYLEIRKYNDDKKDALSKTLNLTVPSIITSALCFFAATFGVSIYTKIDMIGSICNLLSRGSIISMIVVITILPSLLLIMDKVIVRKKKEGKTMKKVKKALTTALICILIISPLSALALNKDETVYSSINYDGNANKTIVNNKLLTTENGEVHDNSVLTSILNLNGDESFSLDGSNVTWQANGKNIFYQGITNQKLPINVVTKIYYNNKLVKNPSDIIGKKGKIQLEINLINNSLIKNAYVPYVSIVGTMIDNEMNSNIKINNGKIINTGTRSTIVGIAAPGLYESTKISEFKSLNKIVITYNTTNFTLNDIYMVSSPKLLSDVDLKVFNKIDTLTKSIDLLDSSMEKLETGAKELGNGSTKLVNGVNDLSDSLLIVKNSINDLKNGTLGINDGLETIISSLEKALNQIDLDQINYLNEQNINTITTITNSNNRIKQTYDKYNLKDFATVEKLINYLNSQGFNDATINMLVNCKVIYENTYESNNNLVKLLQGDEKITSSLLNISSKLNELLDGLKKIKAGNSEISNGLTKLNSGIDKLYNGSLTLKNGVITLDNGISTLKNGIVKVNEEGIDPLSMYSNKLSSYSNSFKNIVLSSKNYKGYASNNATNTTIIYKIIK